MGTGIEWSDETWNPILGCSHVSAGCDNCYAAREASGRLKNHPLYEGLAVDGKFTGKVRLVPERLDQPLRWKRPRRVFVNSMSDLFHDDVSAAFVLDVFAVMAIASRHQFQILTKRPGRMASMLGLDSFQDQLQQRVEDALTGSPARAWPIVRSRYLQLRGRQESWLPLVSWPLPNVWLGTSVETQKWAAVRIPKLLETPAAVRFLSCEPLLGPIDLTSIRSGKSVLDVMAGGVVDDDGSHFTGTCIDWVIVGGESGPHARPMHPSWARKIRRQCIDAGVPYLFKQWGEWAPEASPTFAGEMLAMDGAQPMYRVGRKAAGRDLDGQTWDEYPAELAGVPS